MTDSPVAQNKTVRWTPEEYRSKPREYDPGLCDFILDRIANGELLIAVCKEREMPLPATFLRWCDEDPSLAERYEQALRYQAETIREEAAAEAYGANTFRASLIHGALTKHYQTALPAKYGPRATLVTPEKPNEDHAGIDYAAEVRRKLRGMADRIASEAEPEAKVTGS